MIRRKFCKSPRSAIGLAWIQPGKTLAAIMLAGLLQMLYAPLVGGITDDALRQAQTLERTGDYKQALVQYDRSLLSDPKNDLALRGRAHCLVELNDPGRALKIYDSMLERNRDPHVLTDRAGAFYGKRELTKALADLNEALKARPQRPAALKARAMIFLQQGQFKKALLDLDDYCRCCPNSWTAFSCRTVGRAFAGENLGSFQDLTQYFYIKRNVSFHIRYSAERADVEDTAHPGPIKPPELLISNDDCARLRAAAASKLGAETSANYRAQAAVSFFEHDYRRALSELSKVKATGAELASLLGLRSVCKRATGAFEESLKEARKAIAIAPNERVYYDTLDGAYFAGNKREEGLKELNKIDRERPNNPALMMTLADVNSQLGNRDQTRTILNRLLSLKPDCAEALVMRADSYMGDSMNEKALSDYSKARQLSPRDGKAIEGVGFCCYELNQIDKAMEAFEAVAKLGYDLKRVYAARALCLDRKGKAAMAARLREESNDLML